MISADHAGIVCGLCGRAPGRGKRIRFVTRRIRVCQQCVTTITTGEPPYVFAQQIEAELTARQCTEVRKLTDQLRIRRMKKLDIPTFQFNHGRALEEGQRLLKRARGPIRWTFEGLFQPALRQRSIAEAAQILHRDALAAHVKNVRSIEGYNRFIDWDIARREAHLKSFERSADELFTEYIMGISAFSPGNRRTKIIVMAFRLGIVTRTAEKIARAEDDEYLRLRARIIEEDGAACVICGAPRWRELHVHHIISLARYGTHHPANLVTLCHRCHQWVHRKDGIKVTRMLPIQRARSLIFRRK